MALVRAFVLLDDIASVLGPEGCLVTGFYTHLRKMAGKIAGCINDRRLRNQIIVGPTGGYLSREDKEILQDAIARIDGMKEALQDVPRRVRKD
jgi:hypothetical protein